MDIVVWLRSLGLGRYEAAFRENDVDEMVLPGLTCETLQELGVTAVGQRLKLLEGIPAWTRERRPMAKYIPSPYDWVREQVELYESSGGTKGTTLRDSGLPVVIVTYRGHKTGAIRKTPLMRVKDGDNYVLVGSQGGAPKDPAWVHNLRAEPHIELRDETVVRSMRVHEVENGAERTRLWTIAVAAYPPYAEYQARTKRQIPVFIAEP
jgi:deazaflavin-dependent oxidoreductase (nitroreductase family)